MHKSYSSNYVRIYFWQVLGLLVRFLSMFIVTPYLANNKAIYGIYAICISVTIFLNYADLGFLRAGQKFAAESFSRNDRLSEMRNLGFGVFMLLCFVVPYCLIFFLISYSPDILIKGLKDAKEIDVATSLLRILVLFSPFMILQRVISQIFEIRLEGHLFQRISLLTSTITLASVFFFFSNGRYNIVSYFFFSQFMNLIASLMSIFVLKSRFNYDLLGFLKQVRFDKEIFARSKQLAFSSLYVMIAWVAFYELDQVAIGRIWGANEAALFAVGFSVANVFRTIFGIFFGPFSIRANHYVGAFDEIDLRAFVDRLLTLSIPVTILPAIAMALIAQPFVKSWVGPGYDISSKLIVIFSLMYCFCFSSYIAGMLLNSQERIKEMYFISTLQPLLFWGGAFFAWNFGKLNLLVFVTLKFGVSFLAQIFYSTILIKFSQIGIIAYLKKITLLSLLPSGVLAATLLLLRDFFPTEKSHLNLIIVLFLTGISLTLSLLVAYAISHDFRALIKQTLLPQFAPKRIR